MVVNASDWVVLAVAVIGSGGAGAFIVALMKIKPERDNLAVTASQGAVVLQTTVMENLLQDNVRLRADLVAEKGLTVSCEEDLDNLREHYEARLNELTKDILGISERRENRRDRDPEPL